MTENKTNDLQAFINAYEGRAGAPETSWLVSARETAINKFIDSGLPGPGQEEWKYTNLSTLKGIDFLQPGNEGPEVSSGVLEELGLSGLGCHRAVFIDGRFNPDLSDLPDAAGGIKVLDLNEALKDDPSLLEEFFGENDTFDFEIFADLNTALFAGGVFIQVKGGADVAEPLHLVHLNSSPDGLAMAHPRNIIRVEDGAGLKLIEEYCGPDNSAYLTNSFTAFKVGSNARAVHYRLVREGDQATHISNLAIQQGSDSRFTSNSYCFSGRLVRNDVIASLDGEGIECTLNGLTIGRGEDHVDNHTRIIHSQPNCNSWEMYKTVLADKAHGVFNGKIFVAQDAQKTDAKQSNKSLLLSDTAVMDSKPELEIYADDVKCTHGATIGQLNEEGLFYLRSRGIDENAARVLLVYAFASDLLTSIEFPPLRVELEKILFERLPGHCEPAGLPDGAA